MDSVGQKYKIAKEFPGSNNPFLMVSKFNRGLEL